MAYLALARKWRPKVFSEVVGQTHVVQALANALDSGRIHHAFLFTGTRGVGKTTLARIFAKSLNCESGTSAEPCQQCATCTSIDEGRYVDLIEVDAASRTKVDDTRELLENVQYAATMGKYKVYLIDEVHMLSGHSFNALLKTLEEPPEHVKFLFATTDPQKLPVTVVSRCLQFNLRAMRPEQVENQLVKILASEGIEFDQTALHALAKAADGSMRDGLSLLDQAIAQGGGAVKSADVESMLGTIKAEHSQALLEGLANQDVDQIMQIVADMADNAVDFSTAIDDVLMLLYHVSMAQIAPNSYAVSDGNSHIVTQVAENVDAETIQLYYQIALIGKRDIALAPSSRVGFEMSLLRMLAFEPSEANTVNSPNQSVAASQITSSETKQTIAPSPSLANVASNAAMAVNEPSAAVVNEPSAVASNEPITPVSQTPDSPMSEEAAVAAPSSIAITLAGNNEWGELIEQTSLVGLSKELAINCACERLSDDKIQLCLAPQLQHLYKDERKNDIQEALRDHTKTQLIVELDIEPSDKETPAECLARLGHEQYEQTRQVLGDDPVVQALQSEFGATMNEQSIKPAQ